MKTIAACLALLWLSLVAEHARSDLIPSGALIIPVAVGCIFWLRSGTGIFMAGFTLLIGWLLRPVGPPAACVLIVLMSTWLLTRQPAHTSWKQRRRTEWIQLVLTALCGIVVHAVFTSSLRALPSEIWGRLPATGSVLLIAAIVVRSADEFGLRPQLDG